MTTRQPTFIPAATYLAQRRDRDRRQRARREQLREQAQLSRCGACGQWTWGGVCTLHPTAGTGYPATRADEAR